MRSLLSGCRRFESGRGTTHRPSSGPYQGPGGAVIVVLLRVVSPHLARSGRPAGRVEPIRDGVQVVPEEAGVDVQRHGRRGVPEHALHGMAAAQPSVASRYLRFGDAPSKRTPGVRSPRPRTRWAAPTARSSGPGGRSVIAVRLRGTPTRTAWRCQKQSVLPPGLEQFRRRVSGL